MSQVQPNHRKPLETGSGMERFNALPLTPEERRLILHDNAAAFLGLD